MYDTQQSPAYDYTPVTETQTEKEQEVYEKKELKQEREGLENYGFRKASSDANKENFRKGDVNLEEGIQEFFNANLGQLATVVAKAISLQPEIFYHDSDLTWIVDRELAIVMGNAGVITDEEREEILDEVARNLGTFVSFEGSSHIENF